jgi:hypothetical protein
MENIAQSVPRSGYRSNKRCTNTSVTSLRRVTFTLTALRTSDSARNVRFVTLRAVSVKITVLWDVSPCSLVDTKVSEELDASVFNVEKTHRAVYELGSYSRDARFETGL